MNPSLFRQFSGRVLNLLLWLTFCAMAGTGLLLVFRLPPGSRGGRGLSVLGLTRHEWGDIHTWLSYGFIALILLHLAVHWRWLWQFASRKRTWPMTLGVGAGLALVVILVCLPVQTRDDRGEHHHAGTPSAETPR